MVVDALGRPLCSLRLSLTDRCNLRCRYCMPPGPPAWLPRGALLDFDEIVRLVRLFVTLGVDRARLTGGEPLLRRGVAALVAALRRIEGLSDLSLTTNGLLLAEQAAALRAAGLDRVTVSLDTLQPERFLRLARRGGLESVLAGLQAARDCGFAPLKIDTVVLRNVNDDELGDLLDFGRRMDAEVRFIEYMDVGGMTDWTQADVVSGYEIRGIIEQQRGAAEPIADRGTAPAQRYRLGDGTTFGIIASTTAPFCGDCTRARLSSDGRFHPCLHAVRTIDLKTPLRAGHSDSQLLDLIESTWRVRDDRGAEPPPAAHRVSDGGRGSRPRMHARGG